METLPTPPAGDSLYQMTTFTCGNHTVGVEFSPSSKDIPIERVSLAAIRQITEALSYATHIEIRRCLTSAEMPRLIQVLENEDCRLEKLTFSGCQLTLDDLSMIARLLKANVVPLVNLSISPFPKSVDETTVFEMFQEIMQTNPYLHNCLIGQTALDYGPAKETFKPLFKRNALIQITQTLTLQALCLKQLRQDGTDTISILSAFPSSRLGIETFVDRELSEISLEERGEIDKKMASPTGISELMLESLDGLIDHKKQLGDELYPSEPATSAAS